MALNAEYIQREVEELSEKCATSSRIDPALYTKYDVKKGLRDLNGKGVLAGLTEISEVNATKEVNGVTVPADGELFYRGYNVKDLVRGSFREGRFGFEEAAYLLIMGELPTEKELNDFCELLAEFHTLPKNFVRDVIMKTPSEDMMNTLMRCVLSLFPYDPSPNDTSLPNVMRQCLQLLAEFPIFSVYSYAASSFYNNDDSLVIHRPRADYSTAENILHMLRQDTNFSRLEAKVLDMALVLHAEHGGGNNSSFTMHVVTSSGTDTYSAMAAALASLKGPRHGGANIRVDQMFADMKKNIDVSSDKAIAQYLEDLLEGKAFDGAGLIYGMGHAVYSISDPRARIFKGSVEQLAREKGLEKEYALYAKVEELAPEIIAKRRKIYKGVSANVDFYSGFAYRMLGIPTELFTPIFAIARVAGWSAHRMEELVSAGKIIRPAYKSVAPRREYVPMKDRGAVFLFDLFFFELPRHVALRIDDPRHRDEFRALVHAVKEQIIFDGYLAVFVFQRPDGQIDGVSVREFAQLFRLAEEALGKQLCRLRVQEFIRYVAHCFRNVAEGRLQQLDAVIIHGASPQVFLSLRKAYSVFVRPRCIPFRQASNRSRCRTAARHNIPCSERPYPRSRFWSGTQAAASRARCAKYRQNCF